MNSDLILFMLCLEVSSPLGPTANAPALPSMGPGSHEPCSSHPQPAQGHIAHIPS